MITEDAFSTENRSFPQKARKFFISAFIFGEILSSLPLIWALNDKVPLFILILSGSLKKENAFKMFARLRFSALSVKLPQAFLSIFPANLPADCLQKAKIC